MTTITNVTTQEAIQRGTNLLAVSIVALSGIAFFPEFFLEDEGPFKLDEVGLLVVGLAGIAWYLIGRHKFSRSLVPLVLVGAGLLIKIIGLVIEFGDTEDRGDDIGALILFVLAVVLVAWQYFNGRRAAQAGGS